MNRCLTDDERLQLLALIQKRDDECGDLTVRLLEQAKASFVLSGDGVLWVYVHKLSCLRYIEDRRAQIEEVASEFYGREIKVEITAADDPAVHAKIASGSDLPHNADDPKADNEAAPEETTATESQTRQPPNRNGNHPHAAMGESDGSDDRKPTHEHAAGNPQASARSLRTSSSAEWRAWGEQLARAALQRCPAILYDWLPGGRINGREFEAGDANGAPGRSLKVNLQTGKWKDFASDEPGGSNLVSLYARIRNLEYRDAQRELAEQFAIERPKPVKLVPEAWELVTPVPDFAPFDQDGLPVLPELPSRCAGAQLGSIWPYRDQAGRILLYRARLNLLDGTKNVLPLTFARNRESGVTRWRWKDVPAPRSLYGLELLSANPDKPILIVEGEKTCDAARQLLPDWQVITWPGGSGRVSSKFTDWSPIINRPGRKVIWLDADPPGVKAAAVLADILGRCELVQLDRAWPGGWDLADAKQRGWDTNRVLEYLNNHLLTPKETIRNQRVEVHIASADLDEQSRAVWDAVNHIDKPPELVTSHAGFALVDRDLLGRARRRIVKPDLLRHWLTARIAFKRFSKEGPVGAKPSDALLQNLLAYNRPPLDFLHRMTEVPIFAPDGRLITTEGFDADSGIYYLPRPELADLDIEAGPPTQAEIESARALIDDLIFDFPFVSDCDRAHAYAFMLLPLVRLTINGRTPLFRFEALQPRTGKSLLMRILARLTCTTISDTSAPEDEDEWRKRITSIMREDPDAFLIDNASALDSAQLAKLLTDDVWEDRQLGGNEQVRFPVRCVFGATLNNPILAREIIGRSLRIRLDARSGRPEQRTEFRHPNIEEYARETRARLVGALVTLARTATGSNPDAPILGGYEAFCRRMSAILKAIGVSGFLRDRDDLTSLSAAEAALVTFVKAWGEKKNTARVTVSDLLAIAKEVEGLELGRSDNERSQQTALGQYSLVLDRQTLARGHRRGGTPPIRSGDHDSIVEIHRHVKPGR